MQESFFTLGVSPRVVRVLERRGITAPFAVQQLGLPAPSLASTSSRRRPRAPARHSHSGSRSSSGSPRLAAGRACTRTSAPVHVRLERQVEQGGARSSTREHSLAKFESGNVTTLVATDVAARGLDVDAITHVINFDPPRTGDDYVHRVGRTGRAGRRGTGVTVVLPGAADRRRQASRAPRPRLVVRGVRRPPARTPPPSAPRLSESGPVFLRRCSSVPGRGVPFAA